MSNRATLTAVLVALAVGVVASLALRPPRPVVLEGGQAAGTVVRWRVPTAFGTHLPGLGDNILWVSERAAAASGGRISLEVFEPGEVVPAFAIVDAVHDAKIEAGYTWMGYDQGKLPASVLFGAVPFGLEPWGFTAWWYEGGGRELGREIYAVQGVHPILCGIIGPETAGWFRSELEGPGDLEGLKIRFAGLGGKVMQRLGASVTMLPGGEIFQALEKGAIDATEYSLPTVDERLGFDRVARFNYFPGWHQPFTASHLVVNQREWQALDAPTQALIETTCTAGVMRNLSRAEALQGSVLRGFEQRGVRTLRLPDELLAELRRVSDEVLADEASKDADFARVLASQRAFTADYARWRSLAYPRHDD
jgi:TRAP-type mannitol/chloroaromatic compound transport system substrate-binding protein